LQAGFECSSQKLRSGKRLDLLRATQHDSFAVADYRRLHRFGISTIRTAARWHLIEQAPDEYDFESLTILLEAASETGSEIILDLLHFGWPDHIDIFDSSFVTKFGRFVRALTRVVKRWRDTCTMFAPVNEISFLSWAGGDAGAINPHEQGRDHELKRILVRAATTASEILLNELDRIRLVSPEPVIHIVGNPDLPGDDAEAELYRAAQFQAWDMLCGRMAPELGGRPEYLDIIGTNFYERNEWVHNTRSALSRTDARYRPFHKILSEVWQRYQRPLFVSETGTENDSRADWFNYICDEVITAHSLGIPVHGICLYPIVNHPGWEDDRYCCNGLFDYADASGNRGLYWPLAHAILDQQPKLQRSYQQTHDLEQRRPDLSISSEVEFCIPTSSTPNEPVCT
ncbi:MAG: hypothetical protein JO145_10590, partial [Acidobacteriaceae bacterium]|nr:hypothetical protein [Acidobacteriaceae bacterium]